LERTPLSTMSLLARVISYLVTAIFGRYPLLQTMLTFHPVRAYSAMLNAKFY